MPQISIIIPLLVVGILFGSIIRSGKKNFPRKSILVAALLSAGLNVTYPYVVAMATAAVVDVGFYIASFLAGLVFVLSVFAVAAVYSRVRGQGEFAPPQEWELGQQSEHVKS